LQITFTAPADATQVVVRCYNDAAQGAVGWVQYDGAQLEQKTYATSFVDGTRVADTLTVPTAGLLSTSAGTMECWIKLSRSPGTTPQYIFDGAGATNQNIAFYVGTDGKLHCDYGTGATTINLVGTTVLSANTWYRVVVRWSSSGVAVLLNNGVIEASNATTPSLSFGVNAYLGSKADGTSHLDGLIDDLRISNIARSDTEISNAFNSGQPLQADANTTLLLNFDGPDAQRAAKTLVI